MGHFYLGRPVYIEIQLVNTHIKKQICINNIVYFKFYLQNMTFNKLICYIQK